MKKNPSMKLGDATIHPGERVTLALPMPEVYSYAPTYMPVHVIHGKQEGPCLLVCAALSGDEITGVAVIERLLKSSALKRVKGTLIAVPVVNVFGLMEQTRLNFDGCDISREFPGADSGSFASRIAHLFTQELLSKATHCIDLQSGKREEYRYPHVYADLNDEKNKRFALSFRVPVLWNVHEVKNRTLQATAREKGIEFMSYMAGEAMRFDDLSVRIGLKGILHVMRTLEMLPKGTTRSEKKWDPIIVDDMVNVHAPRSGIFEPEKKLGRQVDQDQPLGVVSDPFGTNQEYRITSPESGIILSRKMKPLLNEGELLFRIAPTGAAPQVAETMGEWHEAVAAEKDPET